MTRNPWGQNAALTCLPMIMVICVGGQKISLRGDAVVGRNFTLDCTVTREVNNNDQIVWRTIDGVKRTAIYGTRTCDSSIALSMGVQPGLSGSCVRTGTEEVYMLTIDNVTESMGRYIWRCENNSFTSLSAEEVQLNITVMLLSVTLRPPSSPLVAGSPVTFTCVTSPSNPSACVRWYIDNREITTGQPPCNQDTASAQPTTSTQVVTATAADNGTELYCTAENRVTATAVRSQSYKLNVQEQSTPGTTGNTTEAPPPLQGECDKPLAIPFLAIACVLLVVYVVIIVALACTRKNKERREAKPGRTEPPNTTNGTTEPPKPANGKTEPPKSTNEEPEKRRRRRKWVPALFGIGIVFALIAIVLLAVSLCGVSVCRALVKTGIAFCVISVVLLIVVAILLYVATKNKRCRENSCNSRDVAMKDRRGSNH